MATLSNGLLMTTAGIASLAVVSLAVTPAQAETVDLVYSVHASSETLDPHRGTGHFDHLATIALFDPLIWDFDASKPIDEMRGYRPMLAESWEIIDDLTWRMHLRQGVVFHNGAPFNAEAVKYSIERPHQPGFDTGDKILDVPISHVEIIDDYTVDIVTHEPVPIMPTRLTRNGAFIMEPGHYEGLSREEAANNPVGTGPFKLVEWQRDRHMILERNEDYWGPKPNYDRLILRVIPELSTALAEAMTGGVDIAAINPDMVEQVRAADGVDVIIADSLVRATLIVNLEAHEALSDKRVRQAIAWAIDSEALIDAYALGVAEQSVTMVNPPHHHPDLEPYGYDPDKARALLDEAGWGDGFSIELDVHYPEAFDWMEAVAFMLGNVGIDVPAVNLLSRSVWLERWNARTLNPHGHHWSAGENVPETDMWAVHPNRPTNSTNWVDDEWLSLYDELSVTVDPDERDKINRRLQEILYEELPWIVLWRVPLVYAVSDRIEGYYPHPSFLVEDYTSIRVID